MIRNPAKVPFCAALLAAAMLIFAGPLPTRAEENDGAADPCDAFARAAAAGTSATSSASEAPQPGSDGNFEAKFRRQTENGQKGLECARRLTEQFKTLRTSTEPEQAEKVLDEYTEVYKKLLNGLEGDGMLLEEANLFLNVIAARLKEAESRSPEAVKTEEERKQRLSEQIDTIVKFKADLDRQLIDIVSRKKDISFYIRGKKIDEVIQLFGTFNDGLSQSVNEMNRTLQPPAPAQSAGSF